MYPVAIIGAGPTGLVSSILLSLRGIPHVLFERHPGTSIHPKACGLNQRTMEILRQCGVESDILAVCSPTERAGRTAWYTGLGPDGREITSRDAWGGGKYAAEYAKVSPCRYTIMPQIRLEPILLRRARSLNPDAIRFRNEVIAIQEERDYVVLKVRDLVTGAIHEYRTSYLIAADGGRMVTDAIGIPWNGKRDIFDALTAHFRAPIREHLKDPRNFITWFINPEIGSIGTGYLYHLGPYPATGPTEEWVFACAVGEDDPARFDQKTMTARIRKTLGLPNLPVELYSLSHWHVNSIVAEKFRSDGGRIFLAGDAAHRVPPWGALGLNTSVQDANNLVWKLDLALRNPKKYTRLLDTYDTERRPIAERVSQSSLLNVRSHTLVMDRALGLSPRQTQKENMASMAAYFNAKDPQCRSRRSAVKRALDLLDSEFKALGAEVGWYYPSADLNNEGEETMHDDQMLGDGSMDVWDYYPSTIPGHHLPHGWLRKHNKTISTRDLLRLDKFLLLTKSKKWEAVQSELVDVEVIGGSHGWHLASDIPGAWEILMSIKEDGAILIRPDGIVAWRTRPEEAVDDWPSLLDWILHVQDESSVVNIYHQSESDDSDGDNDHLDIEEGGWGAPVSPALGNGEKHLYGMPYAGFI